MKKMTVVGSYHVYIGSGILTKFSKLVNLNNYSKIVVITDKLVEKHTLGKLWKILPAGSEKVVLENGEQSKNIETVQGIWQKLLLFGCDRKSLVINLGGGVITDLGGFAASTFMRGIDFINIPTTLLAQVDASIGGKTGIDFAGIKNLIGSFNQPISVICDVKLLSTLPDREFIAGFAEIIKHGLIASKEYFSFVTSKHPRDYNEREFIEIILGSVKIKTDVINKDEKEGSKRKLLNFGHTIGHAIESLSWETKSPFLHGEAISIGTALEAKISYLLKKLTDTDLHIIEQSLINAGLPVNLLKNHLRVEKILEKIKSDKKNTGGKINWTLLSGIGKAIYDQKVEEAIVRKVL